MTFTLGQKVRTHGNLGTLIFVHKDKALVEDDNSGLLHLIHVDHVERPVPPIQASSSEKVGLVLADTIRRHWRDDQRVIQTDFEGERIMIIRMKDQ